MNVKKNMMTNIIWSIKHIFYLIFAYLEIDIEVFLILVSFMSIDSLFGSIASVRMGKVFSFKKLLWGFCLKLCFLIIPLIVALLGKGLGHDYAIGVDIVMKVLILSETYSIFGNIYTAKNKKNVNKMDFVSMLLKSCRLLIKKLIKSFLDKIESGDKCFNENKKNDENSIN